MVRRGGVYYIEHPEWGRRPVVVLTRDVAIPVLRRVTVASISRRIRGIPTEVVIDEEDGMPERCAVNVDNLIEAWKVLLVDHVATLSYQRMLEVCRALAFAHGCQ